MKFILGLLVGGAVVWFLKEQIKTQVSWLYAWVKARWFTKNTTP